MLDQLRRFLENEGGQDLIEYSLLMVLIVIACMWFVAAGRSPVAGVWTRANGQVTNAAIVANGN